MLVKWLYLLVHLFFRFFCLILYAMKRFMITAGLGMGKLRIRRWSRISTWLFILLARQSRHLIFFNQVIMQTLPCSFFLGCELDILSWCFRCILCLFSDDCLHLGKCIVKPGLLKLHLQVVDSAHLQPRDEPSGIPLDCHCRFQYNFLHILSLLCQGLDLALHHVCILAQFHLRPQLLLVQLLKQLSLPINRAAQLGDFLGGFREVRGWRWENWIGVQCIVASTRRTGFGLRSGWHRLKTPSRCCLSWTSWRHIIPLLIACIRHGTDF